MANCLDMKKTNLRALRLRKETVQLLTSTQLAYLAGGKPPSNDLTLCLTVKTCVSFEFSC